MPGMNKVILSCHEATAVNRGRSALNALSALDIKQTSTSVALSNSARVPVGQLDAPILSSRGFQPSAVQRLPTRKNET